MLRLLLVCVPLLGTSCSPLITTPVKVLGKAATTTIGLAGKAAGAGIDALSPDSPAEAE